LARRTLGEDSPEAVLARGDVVAVVSAGELAGLRQELAAIAVREEVLAYAVDVVRRTRAHENILVGGGPRAMQALLLASRSFAAIAGRDFVTPDDVKSAAYPVLEHRLVLRPEFEIEGVSITEAIGQVLDTIPVPR
jgi:MoxR-like ATPase